MPDQLAPAFEAARTHLQQTHGNDPRKACWVARQRDYEPEPLPSEYIRSQPGLVAWIAASADRTGILVLSSGGAVELVGWDQLLHPHHNPQGTTR